MCVELFTHILFIYQGGNMQEMTKETLNSLKETFISYINSIEREGFRKDELLRKLENSDFFTAPASTRFHNCIEGGLLDHSLNVYYNLRSLVERKGLSDKISDESMLIVGLLHDMAKINFYKVYYKNEKVYHDAGTKRDEGGRYDWVAKKAYTVIDDEERFLFGNHEQTSEYMIRTFVPLTYAESVAILHHHGGMGADCAKDNISAIYNRYPLAALLHIADMISTYVDESTDEQIY